MAERPTDSKIMLKDVPSQIFAMTTAQSEKLGLERQKMLPSIKPHSRRRKAAAMPKQPNA